MAQTLLTQLGSLEKSYHSLMLAREPKEAGCYSSTFGRACPTDRWLGPASRPLRAEQSQLARYPALLQPMQQEQVPPHLPNSNDIFRNFGENVLTDLASWNIDFSVLPMFCLDEQNKCRGCIFLIYSVRI